jgi:hypothetical protein
LGALSVPAKDFYKPVAVEAPAPAAPAVSRDLTPKQEIAALEKRIAADQARLKQLLTPKVEYPKWVEGRIVNSRDEE